MSATDNLITSTIVRGAGAALIALAIAGIGEARSAPIAPVKTEAPSGRYTLDKAHASLTFRVNHIGFSNYTAQFKRFDAKLELDTKDPALSKVTATIDPRSLDLDAPPAGFLDTLLGAKWLNVVTFPTMSFRSTKIELTAPSKARIHGELTLHGVKQPVTLDATFNGGYAGHPYDPNARIGFSARGSFKRSAFGVAEGLPPPGTTMGVGDTVEVIIEAEFNGPPLKQKSANK